MFTNNTLSVYDISFNNDKTSMYLSSMYNECISSIKSFQAYILNKNSQNIDFIEKTVYDLSKFHLDNLNKDIRNENITIEFWFKANTTYKRDIHIDGDDNGIIHRGVSPHPLCSILLYLNDNENPTLLTNINNESYKYKQITNKELYIIFPKKLKSIIFDGTYYHSEICIFDNCCTKDRNVLVIDIWEDYIPLWIENYQSKYLTSSITNESIITIIPDKVINRIPITNYNLDDNFFLDLLYKHNLNCCKVFRDIIPMNDCSSAVFIERELLNKKLYDGYIYIHNEVVIMNSILERMDEPSYINLYDKAIWNEHISITPYFITEDIRKYILANFTKYGELNETDKLLEYILKNITTSTCDEIIKIFSLNKTFKINIQNIFLSEHITTNENNTIVASICLYNDFLYTNDENEIILNPCSLILQNNYYKNKTECQIFIEFLIDIENNI